MLSTNSEGNAPDPQPTPEAEGDVQPVLSANPVAAGAFICSLLGCGRVALAAIVPDGPCFGETFNMPDEGRSIEASIRVNAVDRNVYFGLNEPVPRGEQTGKAGRAREQDIRSIRGFGLDCDLDPAIEVKPGGREAERGRLRELSNHLVEDAAGPTALVGSGNGLQAFWLFADPVRNTPENAARVKALSRRVAKLYGGDATHSLDHLFRVPHTLNWPGASKRKRGRTVATTRGAICDPPRRLSLETLEGAYARVSLDEPRTLEIEGSSALPDVYTAMGVIGFPESIDAELAGRIRVARAANRVLDNLLNGGGGPAQDRSARDYAIACAAFEAGFDDPVEVAHVVAAYSPEKTEEQGERYLARTVMRALSTGLAKREQGQASAFFKDETTAGDHSEALAQPADIFGEDDPAELATLPSGCLPPVIDAFVRTEAERKGVPDSFVAAAALATVGGAIGCALQLQPRRHDPSWLVPGALPVVLVGRPGRKKSPLINEALKPLRQLDRLHYAVWERERAACDAANRSRGKGPGAPPLRPVPALRQHLVDDSTFEKQVRIHKDNPRGIVRAPDELASFLGTLGAYKRSGDGDRSAMLRLLDGGTISLQRVGESAHADSALMGLLASTQPDKIRALARDLGADGFLQRLIFVVDDERDRVGADIPPDAAALAAYDEAVRGLAAIPHHSAVLRLSPEAHVVMAGAWNDMRRLANLPGASAAWESHVSKWEGLLYRLLLVFHALEMWPFFGCVLPDAPVEADTARRACRFAAFLLRHAWRFYSTYYEPAEQNVEARGIAGWLLAHPEHETVTFRDVERARRALQGKRTLTLSAMRELENAAWVVTMDFSPEGPSRWRVNPQIHTRFFERAAREKSERADARRKLQEAGKAQRRLSRD